MYQRLPVDSTVEVTEAELVEHTEGLGLSEREAEAQAVEDVL